MVVLLGVHDVYPATARVEISHQNVPVAISFCLVVVAIIIPTFLPRRPTTSRHHFVVFVGIFALDCEQFVVLW